MCTLSTSVSKFKSLKRNVIANVKHLTDVCYLIDKEDLLETVNQDILNLINQITPKLSERDDLILRPKNYSNRKRKYNDFRPKKSKFQKYNDIWPKKPKFQKLPIHAKPKHPYTRRYGVKAEVMRQWHKVKITLPDAPSAESAISKQQVLEGSFCVVFSKSLHLKWNWKLGKTKLLRHNWGMIYIFAVVPVPEKQFLLE